MSMATIGLLHNLSELAARTAEFQGTALAHLTARPQKSAEDPDPQDSDVVIVSAGPFNEGQEQIVRSAMTRLLTVATGPAGTGKSQLVTALPRHRHPRGQVRDERVDVVAPGIAIGAEGHLQVVEDSVDRDALLQTSADSLDRLDGGRPVFPSVQVEANARRLAVSVWLRGQGRHAPLQG
ncbi:hypothetical protein ACFRLW_42610, partial [Streptomyces sp. NPDC056728]